MSHFHLEMMLGRLPENQKKKSQKIFIARSFSIFQLFDVSSSSSQKEISVSYNLESFFTFCSFWVLRGGLIESLDIFGGKLISLWFIGGEIEKFCRENSADFCFLNEIYGNKSDFPGWYLISRRLGQFWALYISKLLQLTQKIN